MAERLESFPYNGGGGAKVIYPWDEWFDGSPWRLIQGVDFKCSVASMRSICSTTASKRGGRARTSLDGEDIVVQFYRPEQTS